MNWLPVTGFRELYEVSDLGEVRSLPRNTTRGRVLTPRVGTNGRLRVTLTREGVHFYRQVHRLVLEAFTGPCPPGWESCHGPGGETDNRLANLCWGPHEKNMGADRQRDGTDTRGEKNGRAKLTAEDVTNIRGRAAAGEWQGSISNEYGVTRSNVGMIIQRRTWRHIP